MTKSLIALLFSATFSSVAIAQIQYIPAKKVEETKFPIFQNGLTTSKELANFRLNLEYGSTNDTLLEVGSDQQIKLPSGRHHLELTYEQLLQKDGKIRALINGKKTLEASLAAPTETGTTSGPFQTADKNIKLSGDFTILASFQADKNASGTLFSKCLPDNREWTRDAKALYFRNGRLIYDIGWLGAMSGGPRLDDGKPHTAMLSVMGGKATLYVDGKEEATKGNFSAPDHNQFVFKVGAAAPNFGKDLKNCQIEKVEYWQKSLKPDQLSTTASAFSWPVAKQSTQNIPAPAKPAETFGGLGVIGIPTKLTLKADDGFQIREAWVQPLEMTAHADQIAALNDAAFEKGQQIYNTLCITCHGTPQQEGSLPTALKFHEGQFKNGSDPYRMYQTLTKGYGIMVPQPQYSEEQKYAVIHYIREGLVKPNNPSQYFKVSSDYLAELPIGLETIEKVKPPQVSEKPYELMDFGPALMWTYQVDKDGPLNIAQKGISIRLDSGQGGVSKGKAWMLYEHDTLRVAAAYSGNFVDWRGIAFDGSHGTHTSIAGNRLFITEDSPAWENPMKGGWEDVRVVGRDERKYGPLPSDWMRFQGIYYHGDSVPVLKYRVGKTEILEQPGFINYGAATIFTRTLNVEKSPHDLVSNLAPNTEGLTALLKADCGIELVKTDKHIQLKIPASSTPAKILVAFSNSDEATVQGLLLDPADLSKYTKGGPARFGKKVLEVEGQLGDPNSPFAVDTIPIPNKTENPWNAWMRLGGFDFYPDNPNRAAVCTWNGDVWLVDGISGDLKKIQWRRICSGLFQPLGLKIVDGHIYVTCRDQIAKLHDFNGDEEIDFVECFNNHAQVTEHFHEFAMGLQTDEKGNFYYAKSARHAKVAVVPHHGTLLRVSPDGSKTDIVATGFRAANGVCLNPDGTWIVTDQEGHWNPKNRINYVREGGFYGNMYGYHDVEDESDSAMEQPLCWITNAFDRSPAELIWVPKDAKWGNLNGVLLNLSYGYGQIYTVPHEILKNGQAQGGMCSLPIDKLPTGVHRGRFHPENGQLYAVGMFAWAGSQRGDGGFFRIRKTNKPAYLPINVQATKGKYTLTFTDKLPENGGYHVKAWDLKRTKSYGSKHYNERELKIANAQVNGNTLTLDIPDLQPTWGLEVRCKFSNGEERVLHSSIHEL